MARLRVPAGRRARRVRCVERFEISANWGWLDDGDARCDCEGTYEPNCGTGPEKSWFITDGSSEV